MWARCTIRRWEKSQSMAKRERELEHIQVKNRGRRFERRLQKGGECGSGGGGRKCQHPFLDVNVQAAVPENRWKNRLWQEEISVSPPLWGLLPPPPPPPLSLTFLEVSFFPLTPIDSRHPTTTPPRGCSTCGGRVRPGDRRHADCRCNHTSYFPEVGRSERRPADSGKAAVWGQRWWLMLLLRLLDWVGNISGQSVQLDAQTSLQAACVLFVFLLLLYFSKMCVCHWHVGSCSAENFSANFQFRCLHLIRHRLPKMGQYVVELQPLGGTTEFPKIPPFLAILFKRRFMKRWNPARCAVWLQILTQGV